MHSNALAASNVIQQQTGPLRRCRGVRGGDGRECTDILDVTYVAACVRFMFGKTSLAVVFSMSFLRG